MSEQVGTAPEAEMPRGTRTALILVPVLLALVGVVAASRELPAYEFPCWVLPGGQVIAVPGADDCPLRFLDEIKGVRTTPKDKAKRTELSAMVLRAAEASPDPASASVSVELLRDRERQWVSVRIDPVTRTTVMSRVIAAFAIAAGLMWIPVFLLQRGRSAAALPLGIFYSATVVVAVVATAGRSSEILSRASVYALIIVPAALAHLALVFPYSGQAILRAPNLARVPYFFSGVLAIVATFGLDPNPILWRPYLFLLLAACAAAWGILLMSCYFAIEEAEAALERSRARFVFYGMLVLPMVLAVTLTWGSSPGEILGAYLWMAAMAMPLPIGLAISHYNLFDLGWDVRHWIARLLYFGGGALLSALLVYTALGFIDPDQSLRDLGVLFGAALSCLVVVEALRRPMLGFLESMLTPRLDQLRGHRERYSTAMVELRDEDAATQLLAEVLEAALEAQAGSVLLARAGDWRPASRFGEDAPASLSLVAAAEAVLQDRPIVHLPRELEDADPNARLLTRDGVEIVASVGARERLGLVLLGSNTRKVPYSGIEVDFVAMATSHAANAIQNARVAGELVATERHAATARVAVALMHDIGKDLGWIRRLVMRIAKRRPSDDRYAESLLEIRELTDSVVDRMRKFMHEATAPRTDPPGVLRLDEMLDAALRRLATRHGEQRVHQSIDPEIRGLRCHENVGRVAANLVENGLHASAPNGLVRISLSELDTQWLRLSVSDDGCGLGDDVMARAFEPGFTTRGDQGGTGVGLSVSRDIVEAMGGKIELRKAPGGGTTAAVVVPKAGVARSSHEKHHGKGAEHEA